MDATDTIDSGAGASAPVLTITPKARTKVMEIRDAENSDEPLALSVEVVGMSGSSYTYELTFLPLSEAGPDDIVQHDDDLPVVIPRESVPKLNGATLDMSRDLLRGGLVIDNPNRPSPAILDPDAPPLELTGDTEEKVQQLLDQQINPSIAMHGGQAELVAVEDAIAYVRLSGGCQGCGMASVTLKSGIEVAIRQHIPEIVEVVDVTDHASGSNPYFEAAKK